MKRSPRDKTDIDYLKRIWPILFWRRCKKCNCEFRQEDGWALPFCGLWTYACASCCPTAEEALKVLSKSAYSIKPLEKVALTYCPKCLGRLNPNATECHRDCSFMMPGGKMAAPSNYGHLY